MTAFLAKHCRTASLLLASAFAAPVTAGITPIDPIFVGFRVGADDACDFRTDESANALQDAIDAVPTSGVSYTIRVARNGDYSGVPIEIANRSLELAGGYSDCSDDTPGASNTEIDSDGAFTGPLMQILSNSGAPTAKVTLRDITLTGGDNSAASGGGLLVQDAEVTLLSSVVDDNQAMQGGGIAVLGLRSGIETRLVLDQGSLVSNNHASSSGGGVYCYESAGAATVRLESNSGVVNNHASSGEGGGAYIYGCDLIANSGASGIAALTRSISLNSANGGGGIAIRDDRFSPNARLLIGSELREGDPSPVIASNEAGTFGGGILVRGEGVTEATINDARIAGNQAQRGGGLWVTGGIEVTASRTRRGCGGADDCLLFLDNTASVGGGAVYANGTDTRVSVARARVKGNHSADATGGAALQAVAGARVITYDSVITDNSGASIISMIDGGNPAGGRVTLRASTVAGNHADTAVIYSGASGVFDIQRSIVLDDNVPLVSRDTGNLQGSVWCSLLKETDSLPASALNGDPYSGALVGRNPYFVDAAGGDFHLSFNGLSWALDVCPEHVDPDLFQPFDHDFNTRPVDSPLPDLGPGRTYDVGAYEWTYDLFRDGFED